MAKATFRGLPQLRARLERLRNETRGEVSHALAEAGNKIVAMMKRQVPVESGALRDSIGWTFGDAPKYSQRIASGQAGDIRITIYAGNSKVRYAHLVEFGSAPHTITGKQGGPMYGTKGKWKGKNFGTIVSHPGATARPFFYPSYRVTRKEVARLVRKAVRDAVRKSVT